MTTTQLAKLALEVWSAKPAAMRTIAALEGTVGIYANTYPGFDAGRRAEARALAVELAELTPHKIARESR